MHALDSLISFYNNCKPDDVYFSVVENLLMNLDDLETATIYDWAELCYVSPSTISRLCKKIGYNSFPEFKVELANALHNFHILNRYAPINLIHDYGSEQIAYQKMLSEVVSKFSAGMDKEQFIYFADCIHKYKEVRIYTHGIAFSEGHLQQNLIMAGKKSRFLSSPPEQLNDVVSLNPEVLVIITVPNVHERTLIAVILKKIKEYGACVMVITNSKYSKYLKEADYAYSFNGTMTQLDDYHFAMFLSMLSITYREKYLTERS